MEAPKAEAGALADAPPKEQLAPTAASAAPVEQPIASPPAGVTTAETRDSTTGGANESTAAAGDNSATPPQTESVNIDKSKPEDFEGEVTTTNELPSAEAIKKVENYIVLDRDGKSRTFKSLYSGNNVARRVLVVFIRHFFCGVWLPSNIVPDHRHNC